MTDLAKDAALLERDRATETAKKIVASAQKGGEESQDADLLNLATEYLELIGLVGIASTKGVTFRELKDQLPNRPKRE